ncbi:type II secretion system protein GspJ [Aliiroseovarius sp.]|uniref:type II secretion system protein GspJ n=1 Tax=Aliiroseovarius sp. TaxID=1872442 RepID=UPI003BABE4C7
MIRRERPTSPRAGLSLFELLLSLALLALIAAALSGSLSLGLRLYERADQNAPELDALTLRLQLRHWLDRAAPPHLLTPFPAGFNGGPEQLTFTTLAETPFAPKAAALRVGITLQDDTLRLTATALDHEGKEIDSWTRDLATGAMGLRIHYYQPGEPTGQWLDTWPPGTALPALVRIELDPGSTPDWPELTQRPRYAEP